MSLTVAPSRKACLTFEFMNTVQRVPRSHGAAARQASEAKSPTEKPRVLANVSMNEPQPEEQASFISMRSITPVVYEYGLHVLPADVENERNGRVKIMGRHVVGDCFHDAAAKLEGRLYQVFTVTG